MAWHALLVAYAPNASSSQLQVLARELVNVNWVWIFSGGLNPHDVASLRELIGGDVPS